MLSDTEMLQNIYKGVSMGREGILDVLKVAEDEKFRQALLQQLSEYDNLAESARHMLHQRGHTEEELSTMAKLSSQVMTTMKTINDKSPSKIAELMIKGNTMGVTQSIKNINDYQNGDERILDLSNKLLQTEQNNIEQMKQFL